MRCCAPAATSPQWTSRRAIATGTRSRSWRAARATRSSRSPGARCWPPSARRPSRRERRRRRSPRAGPRLLPHLGRAAGLRDGARISCADAGLARARLRGRGHPRLRWQRSPSSAPSSSRCRCSAWRSSGSADAALCLLALLALVPASDVAVALVNRHVTNRFGPDGAARAGAARRRAGEPAHAGRRADAADDARGDRGADRAPRGAPPRQPGRRPLLRAALGLDGLPPPRARRATRSFSRAAAEGIARLNRRYGPAPDGERFLLLHRRRVWNEGEGKWIGWERKRGKLHELNRLLRGATDTTFLAVGGRPPVVPSGVRYVITLDADTRLPRGAARRLVGKMAHPLNRPRLDPRTRPRGRGLRRAAAARHAVAADRPRGIAVPARLLRSGRHRSVRVRRLRRLPGPLRGRLLHRQGHLRRRRLRGRARQGGFPRARS